MVLIEIITLIVSIAILAKAASVVVENAVTLSNFFGIGQLAIGFLFISICTTLPELSVSVISSTFGQGAISAGNVFGSNIANILVILGTGAALYGLKIHKEDIKDIGIILVLTTTVSSYVIFNSLVSGHALGFLEGVILIMLFCGYIIYMITKRKLRMDGKGITKRDAFYAFLYFMGGLILVLVSSGFVVESAVGISRELNIAESIIGATIIAFGTSLPEFSVSLQAIRKKHYGIALGDIIGANMTNLTLVLGAAAAINPIDVILPVFIAALLFAIIANIFLMYNATINKGISRKWGIALLLMYAFFLAITAYLHLSKPI
ncbi:MAG: sodium:calcium antiporter [Candidatus Micrarchaeota archaeon]|nr:sodium:calcium antiporter [Candidatus Micrarchaeota archaeon]